MSEVSVPMDLVCDLRNHYIEEIRMWEKRYGVLPAMSIKLVIEDMKGRLDRISDIMAEANGRRI